MLFRSENEVMLHVRSSLRAKEGFVELLHRFVVCERRKAEGSDLGAVGWDVAEGRFEAEGAEES